MSVFSLVVLALAGMLPANTASGQHRKPVAHHVVLKGADPPMHTQYPDDLTSDLAVYDVPLDAEVIDDVEFAHIMNRIGIVAGETAEPVSAFNSSI
jgi:hypothetical protein